MSKNTSSNKFRKLNIDDFDPENFKDDTVEGEEQGPNESEVNTFLAQGFRNVQGFQELLKTRGHLPVENVHGVIITSSKNQDALEVILKNPPLGAKSQAVKDKAVNLAIRVLTTFKSSEIDSAVKALDSKLLDVLMKYIYRGFEFPQENSSASLLTWHEKVVAEGGPGCIVRVLTDRKRV